MRKPLLITLACLLNMQIGLAEESTFKNDKEKISYSIGMNFGNNFKAQQYQPDFEAFKQGMEDTFFERETRVSMKDAEQLVRNHFKELSEKRKAADAKKQDENKAIGVKFLEENKSKPGVVVLESGLQYKVIKTGDGLKPASTDKVSTHYKGTLINGKEFDSSYKRGKPATFPVTGVIKGWIEALQLMTVGSKWELYIPAELAYGSRRQGAVIGPNSVLIFELELLGIEGK